MGGGGWGFGRGGRVAVGGEAQVRGGGRGRYGVVVGWLCGGCWVVDVC